VDHQRLAQAGGARAGVPQAPGPLQPPHGGGHRVHPEERGSGVGEVGGQGGSLKWKVQCVRSLTLHPFMLQFVNDDMERVTILMIRWSKEKRE